jgi:hypothetical protein
MGEMVKFLADRTTGKLARKLRALGFDVASLGGGQLEEAATTAALEGRLLLTRSRRLPEARKAPEVLVLEADNPREQVREVLEKLNLEPNAEELFSRCILCNERLVSVPKPEVEGRVPDFIHRTYDSFHVCPRCARVYWPGTHFLRMEKEIAGAGVLGNKKK